jgi:hypothetical protein
VTRALAVLTGVAWAVLVVEQTAMPERFWPAVLAAAGYAPVAVVGAETRRTSCDLLILVE